MLAFVVDATAVHDRGASDVQELAYSMQVAAAYLRALTEAGVSGEDAATLVEFRYAATDEQFPTIAKLRAARRLWARVLELSGTGTTEQRQHVVTSRPMMSAYDPWVNMLRTTSRPSRPASAARTRSRCCRSTARWAGRTRSAAGSPATPARC